MTPNLYNKYTVSLLEAIDLLSDSGTLWENWEWDTTAHLEKLKDMIIAKFYNWEISGETLQEFKLFMYYKFQQYKDYYAEKLNAYETEIDFLDGDKRITEEATSASNTETSTPRAKRQTETYDLPRTDSTINRPSDRTISGGIEGDDTVENEGEGSLERTTKGGNVIRLKKEYLDLLQSVYDQFADKFKPCFIDLFS